jgi:hypothetical protein
MADELEVKIAELAAKYLPLAKEILKGAIIAPLPYVEKGDGNCGLSAGISLFLSSCLSTKPYPSFYFRREASVGLFEGANYFAWGRCEAGRCILQFFWKPRLASRGFGWQNARKASHLSWRSHWHRLSLLSFELSCWFSFFLSFFSLSVAALRESWHKQAGEGVDPYLGLIDKDKVNEEFIRREIGSWIPPKVQLSISISLCPCSDFGVHRTNGKRS